MQARAGYGSGSGSAHPIESDNNSPTQLVRAKLRAFRSLIALKPRSDHLEHLVSNVAAAAAFVRIEPQSSGTDLFT
jgi:hypothetical protein